MSKNKKLEVLSAEVRINSVREEQLNNPDFNPLEFDGIKKQTSLNSFILTAKHWIEATNAHKAIANKITSTRHKYDNFGRIKI